MNRIKYNASKPFEMLRGKTSISVPTFAVRELLFFRPAQPARKAAFPASHHAFAVILLHCHMGTDMIRMVPQHEKSSRFIRSGSFKLVVGLEPTACALRMRCSTN